MCLWQTNANEDGTKTSAVQKLAITVLLTKWYWACQLNCTAITNLKVPSRPNRGSSRCEVGQFQGTLIWVSREMLLDRLAMLGCLETSGKMNLLHGEELTILFLPVFLQFS